MPAKFTSVFPQAKAAAIAAPAVAIGALELLALAAAGAAAVGIISVSQNEEYQRQVDQLVADLREKTGNALKAVLNTSLKTINRMSSTLGMSTCGPVVAAVAAITPIVSSKAGRNTAPGECRPELRDSPFNCCEDFMKTIRKKATVEQVGRNSFKVNYYTKSGNPIRCCFEWDSLHGRFEVYQSSNHTKSGVTHTGERACARESDIEDDICRANFPEKADFSGAHDPRQGCR